MSGKFPTTLLRCAAFLAIGAATVMCNGFFVANAMAAGDSQTTPTVSADADSSQATVSNKNVITAQTPEELKDSVKKYCKKADSIPAKPGKDDVITQQKAIAIAKKTIVKKYALTDAALSKFAACASFWKYIKTPNRSEWIVDFSPADQFKVVDGEFESIALPDSSTDDDLGSYVVHIDPRSGNIIKLSSSADAVG